MIFKGEFFFNLFVFHLYICCVFTSVYLCLCVYLCCVFIYVVCLNSITMLGFFIFVKYLSNIEDNV